MGAFRRSNFCIPRNLAIGVDVRRRRLSAGCPAARIAVERHNACRLAAVFFIPLVLNGCVRSDHLVTARNPTPLFDPVAFFVGHTHGEGTLKVIFQPSQPTRVDGHGTVGPNSTIVLDQDVQRGAAAFTHRTWHLHRVGPGRYAGTLSDASGPVAGEILDNRLHLSFAMKGGLHAQQWLYLKPDGQVAINRMVITKFGVAVASLDETITREQP